MFSIRSAPLALGLSFVLLAGCVGSGDANDGVNATTGAEEPLSADDIDPNSEFGIVQGTVRTDEAMPVEGALVALRQIEAQTATNADGLFVFRDVPPGTYALHVARLGYESTARNVVVEAGRITEVSVSVVALAVLDEAYTEVFHFTGYFECALAVPGWVSACTYPYTAAYLTARDNGVNLSNYGAPSDPQPNKHRFNITIHPHIGQFVGEMVWQPSSAAATRMRLNIKCGDYHPVWDDCVYPYAVEGSSIRYGEAVGTSPLKVVIDGEQFFRLGKGKGEYDLEKNESVWIMNYCSLPHGTTQVAFQQRFEVWDTVFYNGVAPEDYTILRDG